MQEDLELVAESLNIAPLQTSIDLGERGIGDGYVDVFADALRHQHSLEKVNLRRNNLGDRGAIAFAEVLRVNTKLKQLSLLGNNIQHEGVLALARALKVNRTLECLDLSYNEFTTFSEEPLTELLNNKTLISLCLRGCRLTVVAFKLMAEELKLNQTLKSLDCSDNHIQAVAVNALLAVMPYNYSLVRLELGGLHLSLSDAKVVLAKIDDILLRNRKLAVIDHAIQVAWRYVVTPFRVEQLSDYADVVRHGMDFGHHFNEDMLMVDTPIKPLLMSIIALRHASIAHIAMYKIDMLHQLKVLVAACGVNFNDLPNRFALKKFARFFEEPHLINRQRFSLFINPPTPSFNPMPKPIHAAF